MDGAQVVLQVGADVRVGGAKGRVRGGRETNQGDVGDHGTSGAAGTADTPR